MSCRLLWLGAAAVAVAVVMAMARRRKRVPKCWTEIGEVTGLYLYPGKSLKGVSVKEATCTTLGLQHGKMRDRVFLVVDNQNNFVTQRQEPKMALIRPSYQDDTLCLDAPDMPTIRVNVSESSPRVNCRVWQDRIEQVIDCGDEVSAWLSTFLLGEPDGRRLLFYPWDGHRRKVSQKESGIPGYTEDDKGPFSDKTSYLLIAEESVSDLNTRLPSPVTPLNFRPNILIRGAEPYVEDNWKWIQIGSTMFRTALTATRCVLTTVNPETGVKDKNSEPLATLKQYRMVKDPNLLKACGKSPIMGLNLGIRFIGQDASIHVGDKVFVGCDE